jgi:hypothetical protein
MYARWTTHNIDCIHKAIPLRELRKLLIDVGILSLNSKFRLSIPLVNEGKRKLDKGISTIIIEADGLRIGNQIDGYFLHPHINFIAGIGQRPKANPLVPGRGAHLTQAIEPLPIEMEGRGITGGHPNQIGNPIRFSFRTNAGGSIQAIAAHVIPLIEAATSITDKPSAKAKVTIYIRRGPRYAIAGIRSRNLC